VTRLRHQQRSYNFKNLEWACRLCSVVHLTQHQKSRDDGIDAAAKAVAAAAAKLEQLIVVVLRKNACLLRCLWL